jgi:arsenate reductase (glutaredoxin)
MIIYFNPECSKCNSALDLLSENNCEIQIREYLKDPPSVDELKSLISLLNCKAIDIVRKKEPLYLERFDGKKLSENEILQILSENPILIERPIVIDCNNAIIGRPPELVLKLLKKD